MDAGNSFDGQALSAFGSACGLFASVAGAGLLTLDAGGSASAGAYVGRVLAVASGREVGQYRRVAAYAARACTLDTPLDGAPAAGDAWQVFLHSGRVRGGSSRYLLAVEADGLPASGVLVGAYLQWIVPRTGAAATRRVQAAAAGSDADGSFYTLQVDELWDAVPAQGDYFCLFGEAHALAGTPSGTALALASTADAADGLYAGASIKITGGAARGEARLVAASTGRVLTLDRPLNTVPAAGDTVQIFAGWIGNYGDVSAYPAVSAVARQSDLAAPGRFLLALDVARNMQGDGVLECRAYSDARGYAALNHSLLDTWYRARVVNLGPPVTVGLRSRPLTAWRPLAPAGSAGAAGAPAAADAAGQRGVSGALETAESSSIAGSFFSYGVDPRLTGAAAAAATRLAVLTEGAPGVAKVQSLALPPPALLAASGAGSYFLLPSASGVTYGVWFQRGSSSAPSLPGRTLVPVAAAALGTARALAAAVAAAVTATVSFVATAAAGTVTFTDRTGGAVASLQAGTMPVAGNGSVAAAGGMAVLSSGESDFRQLVLRRPLRDCPGLGLHVVISAVFGSPAAGTSQYIGVSNGTSALQVGYNAAQQFVVRRRAGGEPEVRCLTVGSRPTGGGTATLTLDGATYAVALTAGSVQQGARLLAAADYSLSGWAATAADDKVYFVRPAELPAAAGGVYGYAGGGTGSAGTFARVRAATAVTALEWNQASWNADSCDGSGPSGFVLRPQQGTTYRISWGLGFAPIRFDVQDATGGWITMHRDAAAGDSPALRIPHMRLSWEVDNRSAVQEGAVVLRTSSGAGFLEGTRPLPGLRLGCTTTLLTTSTSDVLMLSITMPQLDLSTALPNLDEQAVDALTLLNNSLASIAIYSVWEGGHGGARQRRLPAGRRRRLAGPVLHRRHPLRRPPPHVRLPARLDQPADRPGQPQHRPVRRRHPQRHHRPAEPICHQSQHLRRAELDGTALTAKKNRPTRPVWLHRRPDLRHTEHLCP